MNNRLNRKSVESVEQKFFVCAEHRDDDAMIAISASIPLSSRERAPWGKLDFSDFSLKSAT